MRFELVEGEAGTIRLEVRGHADQPTVDWSGYTLEILILDYTSASIIASTTGIAVDSDSIENEAANTVDSSLWDFDIVATLPAATTPGLHLASFAVMDGATIVYRLPHRRDALSVRVYDAES